MSVLHFKITKKSQDQILLVLDPSARSAPTAGDRRVVRKLIWRQYLGNTSYSTICQENCTRLENEEALEASVIAGGLRFFIDHRKNKTSDVVIQNWLRGYKSSFSQEVIERYVFSAYIHEKEFTIIQLLVDDFLKAEIISFPSTCDGQFISTIFSVSNNRMVNFGLF